jgi:predicted nucleic acid-binding protein
MPLRVVADTGPLNYLIQIDAIGVLPKLFDQIVIPDSVHAELVHPRAPAVVRAWAAEIPGWLVVRPDDGRDWSSAQWRALDKGERATIALATNIGSDLVAMDDRAGVAFARGLGLAVTGTLGVLDLAARQNLIDLAGAFARLKTTSFHYRQGLLDAYLAQRPEPKC